VPKASVTVEKGTRQVVFNRGGLNQRPSQDRVLALLKDALAGEVAHIAELRGASQEQLQLAAQSIDTELVLQRSSVLRVLRDWRAQRVNDEQVRWWALLMSIGAFPDDWTPHGWRVHHSHPPVRIDYSDEVGHVVSGLRDLGDFDDVGRSAADIDQLIRQLSDS